jgi:8-oxo-dGTP pyrophosphatase MutT (NUDIX family)
MDSTTMEAITAFYQSMNISENSNTKVMFGYSGSEQKDISMMQLDHQSSYYRPQDAYSFPALHRPQEAYSFPARPEDDTDDTVGCIVFDCFYRVLLVRGGAPQFKISFPKGSRKIHETKLQGAIREVKEETGLDISSFCINHDPIKFIRGRYYCIKLKWSFESYTLKPAADESGSVFWVYPEELESMDKSSMNRDVNYFKDNMYYGDNLIARHRTIVKHMKQKLTS